MREVPHSHWQLVPSRAGTSFVWLDNKYDLGYISEVFTALRICYAFVQCVLPRGLHLSPKHCLGSINTSFKLYLYGQMDQYFEDLLYIFFNCFILNRPKRSQLPGWFIYKWPMIQFTESFFLNFSWEIISLKDEKVYQQNFLCALWLWI